MQIAIFIEIRFVSVTKKLVQKNLKATWLALLRRCFEGIIN